MVDDTLLTMNSKCTIIVEHIARHGQFVERTDLHVQSPIFEQSSLVYGPPTTFGMDANHIGYIARQMFVYRNYGQGFILKAWFHSK